MLKNNDVTYEEIKQFEPMIHKAIKDEIARYWGYSECHPQRPNTIIARFGLNYEDLVQMGRMWVFNQIKWYKTKKIKDTKLCTFMYPFLKNNFAILSKHFTREKRGGSVFYIEETKQKINNFISNFNSSASVESNKELLKQAIMHSKQVRNLIKNKNTNELLLKFANRVLKHLSVASSFQRPISYEDVHNTALVKNFTPESALIGKEAIKNRIKQWYSVELFNNRRHPKLNKILYNYLDFVLQKIEYNKDTALLLKLFQQSDGKSNDKLICHFKNAVYGINDIFKIENINPQYITNKILQQQKVESPTIECILKCFNKFYNQLLKELNGTA